MRFARFLCAPLLLAVVPAAEAQVRVTALGPGTPVRVSPPGADAARGWVEGQVVFADADSLVIRPRRGGETTFRRDEIGALQVAVLQPRTGSAARYGLVAALVAGGGSAALAALAYDEDDYPDDFLTLSRSQEAMAVGVLVGIPASFVGALVGANVRGDRWTPADLPAAPAVSLRPDGTVGVSLSLKW